MVLFCIRVCIWSILFASVTTASAQTEELVNEAKTGMRQSIHAVKTIRAKFISRVKAADGTFEEEGDYLRIGDTERVHQVTKNGEQHDRLVQGGVVKTLISVPKHTNRNISQAAIESIQNGYSRSSAFYELLIDTCDSAGRTCTYENLLSAHQATLKAEKTSLRGRPCIKITINVSDPGGRPTERSYWHDIKAGYWIAKFEIKIKSKVSLEVNIDQIENIDTGPTFPNHAKWKSFNEKGDVYQTREFRLTNLVLNQPIADHELPLPTPPKGTLLTDEIRGIRGVMDSSWTIIGKSEPFARVLHPDSADTTENLIFGQATQEEPMRLGNILLLGSLACGIVAFVIILVRRFRKRIKTSRPGEGEIRG